MSHTWNHTNKPSLSAFSPSCLSPACWPVPVAPPTAGHAGVSPLPADEHRGCFQVGPLQIKLLGTLVSRSPRGLLLPLPRLHYISSEFLSHQLQEEHSQVPRKPSHGTWSHAHHGRGPVAWALVLGQGAREQSQGHPALPLRPARPPALAPQTTRVSTPQTVTGSWRGHTQHSPHPLPHPPPPHQLYKWCSHRLFPHYPWAGGETVEPEGPRSLQTHRLESSSGTPIR